MMSRRREQSSKTRYFLHPTSQRKNDRQDNKQSYLSISSRTPSIGVHSNISIPGYPGSFEALLGERGIEKIASDTHSPESGTLNLRSIQIAVASLSGFTDNHICQGTGG